MPLLANDILRAQRLKDFFKVNGVVLPEDVRLSATKQLFCFELSGKEDVPAFLRKLEGIVDTEEQKASVSRFSLENLLVQGVLKGEHDDKNQEKVYRQAALGIMTAVIATNPSIDYKQDNGELSVSLLPGFDATLSQLAYSGLSISPSHVSIDLARLMAENESDFLTLETINGSPDILLMNAALLENRIFYKTKPVEGKPKEVEVTPYFVVPKNITPPSYHFMLDVSGSMGKDLITLKNTVLKMAEMVFAFEPEASISISTFSNTVKNIGCYKEKDFRLLKSDVGRVTIEGMTALYAAVKAKLDTIFSLPDQHHNVLLFSDGGENVNKALSVDLEKILNGLDQKSPLKVRNKFYVINYSTTPQADIMQRVVKDFKSEMIDSKNADFIQALQNKGVMQQWAATRDLFQSRLTVSTQEGESIQEASFSVDLSGQLHELASQCVEKGTTVTTEVRDGAGKIIAQSQMKVPDEAPAPMSIAISAVNSPVFSAADRDASKETAIEKDMGSKTDKATCSIP